MSEKRWKIKSSRNSLTAKGASKGRMRQLQIHTPAKRLELIDGIGNVQGKTVNVSEIKMNAENISNSA